MQKKREPMMHKFTLGEFLGKYRNQSIHIPLFHRNYKWDNQTVKKFLADIRKAEETGKETHMIGMMTLYAGTDSGAVQVIDGQQRLITLALLARALGCCDENFPILHFERDTVQKERENFLRREEESGSVDVKHMKSALELLREALKDEKREGRVVFDWMKDHVNLVCRYTENEPLQEFLNINDKKIPFGPADYDKAYLLKHFEEVEEGITPENVIEMHREIQNYLYKKEYEAVFCLAAKKGRGEHSSNRMDVLFAKDRDSMGTDEDEQRSAYRKRFTYLKNCREIFAVLGRGLKEDGQSKLNVNLYNAVRALYQWIDPGLDFFELIDEKPMSGTAFERNVYERFRSPESKNVFMQSQLFEEVQDDIERQLVGAEVAEGYGEMVYKEKMQEVSRGVLDVFDKRVRETEALLEMGKNSERRERGGYEEQ